MTNFLAALSTTKSSNALEGQSLTHNVQPVHVSAFQTTLPRKSWGGSLLANGYLIVTGFLKNDSTISPNIEPIVIILSSRQERNKWSNNFTDNDCQKLKQHHDGSDSPPQPNRLINAQTRKE